MARHRTEAERAREVTAWRASGESASTFARRRGYAEASLRAWASTLTTRAPEFVRVEVVPQGSTDLVVEVGVARVRVAPGFDARLLRDVVMALAAGKS